MTIYRRWLLVVVLALVPILRGWAAGEMPADRPVMSDLLHGWWLQRTSSSALLLHTNDGGRNWLPVPLPDLSGDAELSLCALNARNAWLAWTNNDAVSPSLPMLAYTGNAGGSWRSTRFPFHAESVSISFLDSQHGFLLATLDASLGQMRARLYQTGNGARDWQQAGLPAATGYYPTGVTFRSPTEGWITGAYHGGDSVPLYRSTDGGTTWILQIVPLPPGYEGGYADVYPPVFIGAGTIHGYLPMKLVRHEPAPGYIAWVNFESSDGGLTWQPPRWIFPTPDN